MKKQAVDSTMIGRIDDWKADSEEGLVCGFLRCNEKPVYRCRVCGCHYCEEHVEKHFHLQPTIEKANVEGDLFERVRAQETT